MLSQHQGLAKNRFQSECPHQQSVTFSAGEKEKKIPNVKVKNIKEISIERIRDEITSILSGNRPGEGLKLLDNFGVLEEVIPELIEMKGIQQPPDFHPEGDVFVHTCLALDMLKDDKEKYLCILRCFFRLYY